MKKIECIIRPTKLKELEDKLNSKVSGMTVTYVKGYGQTRGETQFYRGTPMSANLLPKIKVEFVVEDAKMQEIVDLVIETCKTGKLGDGKIFIFDVVDAIRIRTGERKEKAL